MSQPDPTVGARVAAHWQARVTETATRYQLDPWLALACVAQESRGDPYSWRPELEFVERYRPGIESAIDHVPDLTDRRRYARWWKQDPLVLGTSFGLLQVLTIVAIERGVVLRYPSSLCDPAIGLDAGCRQLRWCAQRTQHATEPKRAMLLRYNGGGNPAYADEVEAWESLLLRIAPERATPT